MLKEKQSSTRRGDKLMRLTITSKGEFNRIRGWISDVVNRSPDSAMRQLGVAGDAALAANTPKDTGATAAGWTHDITVYRGKTDLSWMNLAHSHTSINIAKAIELGHGTGTGGYVPPNPYIKQSMHHVFNMTDGLVKELLR